MKIIQIKWQSAVQNNGSIFFTLVKLPNSKQLNISTNIVIFYFSEYDY